MSRHTAAGEYKGLFAVLSAFMILFGGCGEVNQNSENEKLDESYCGDGTIDGDEECEGGPCCNEICRFMSEDFACRPSTGLCDPAEVCSGTTNVCPSDVIFEAGTTCRASTGSCDIAEYCEGTGTDVSCPEDVLAENGTSCDVCSGQDCEVGSCQEGICLAYGETLVEAHERSETVQSSEGSDDDAEEKISDGSVDLRSTDLELIHDKNNDQIVGVRFTDLRIPRGAPIRSAYVEFTADEGNDEETHLTLQLEASDHALPFANTTGNISSRPRTVAQVSWTPEAWVTGDKPRTPDIAALVQEVVDRPGWDSGQAVVLIITGSGHRTADSSEKNGGTTPVLWVVYYEFDNPDCGNNVLDDGEACDGEFCCNPRCELAAGSIECRAAESLCDLPELCDGQSSGCPQDAFVEAGVVCRDAAGLCDVEEICDGNGPDCPDDVVQDSGVVCRAADGECDQAEQCDGDSSQCPNDSFVSDGASCDSGAKVCQLGSCVAAGVYVDESLIAPTPEAETTSDDAEEDSTGEVSLVSPDLQMIDDVDGSGAQTVGLRFVVGVPRGAIIQNAYIQFTSEELQEGAASLVIHAQAADTAPTFKAGSYNISSRPLTVASVPWAPLAWPALPDVDPAVAGEDQRTPNLSEIVQEVVNRPGWAVGQGMAFIISGTGTRTSFAVDGTTATDPAPYEALLHIEYIEGTVPATCGDGEVDQGEDCDGGECCTSGCRFAPASVVCRPRAGDCDQAETCTGSDALCPDDLLDSTTVCRPAVDLCDAPEVCNGVDLACPDDELRPDTHVCRPAVDGFVCDVEETCPGDGVACPPDGFLTQDTTCSFTLDATTYDGSCDDAGDCVVNDAMVESPQSLYSDNAEEEVETGNVKLGRPPGQGNADMEMINDGTIEQIVGLRWPLDVPQGATILHAHVQFTTDRGLNNDKEIDGTPATTPGCAACSSPLILEGEAADSAAEFLTTENFNISSRARTNASIDWTPPPWPTTETTTTDQRTPGLRAIIQEIVDRAGWSSGNYLAIIVRAEEPCRRSARAGYAVLKVEYLAP